MLCELKAILKAPFKNKSDNFERFNFAVLVFLHISYVCMIIYSHSGLFMF